MAIAFDNALTGNTGATTNTVTTSYTCSGSNRILFYCLFGDATSDLITGGTVTYGGVAMTQVGIQSPAASPSGNGLRWLYIYALVGPAAGTHNAVVTATANCDFVGGDLVSYTGVIGTNINGFAAGSNTGNTQLTVGRSSTNDQAWAIAWGIGSISGHHTVLSSATPNAGATRTTIVGNTISVDSNAGITPAGTNQFFTIAEDNSGVTPFGAIVGCFDPGVQPPTGGPPMLGRVGV